jgi:hypothetical protein
VTQQLSFDIISCISYGMQTTNASRTDMLRLVVLIVTAYSYFLKAGNSRSMYFIVDVVFARRIHEIDRLVSLIRLLVLLLLLLLCFSNVLLIV